MNINNVTSNNTETTLKQNIVSKAEENAEMKTDNTLKQGREDYNAISKDGDTLELSNSNKNAGNVKMTDSVLAKCSKSKLKQLLQNGQISRQQYEKALRKA